jgi:hypothetical protein
MNVGVVGVVGEIDEGIYLAREQDPDRHQAEDPVHRPLAPADRASLDHVADHSTRTICEACSWNRIVSADSRGSGQVTATKTRNGATNGTCGAAQITKVDS